MVTGDISGYQYVGGIVGYVEYCEVASNISQCASSGNIIATDGGVGGILGYRYGSYSIENCYSIANVKAEGSYSSSVYGIGCSAKIVISQVRYLVQVMCIQLVSIKQTVTTTLRKQRFLVNQVL